VCVRVCVRACVCVCACGARTTIEGVYSLFLCNCKVKKAVMHFIAYPLFPYYLCTREVKLPYTQHRSPIFPKGASAIPLFPIKALARDVLMLYERFAGMLFGKQEITGDRWIPVQFVCVYVYVCVLKVEACVMCACVCVCVCVCVLKVETSALCVY